MVNPCSPILAAPLLLALATSGAADVVALDMQERLTPEAEVSAEAVFVGLVRPWEARVERGVPPREEDAGAAFVVLDVPADLDERGLCVRVVTADGRYSAEERIPSAGIGGDAMIQGRYMPAYDTIFDYEEPEIAILAWACSAEPATDVTPLTMTFGTWQGPFDGDVDTDAASYLLVNSFRASSAFVVVDGITQISCQPVPEGARAAFDFRCPLQWETVRNGAEITLFRVRGGAMDPPVTARIAGQQ